MGTWDCLMLSMLYLSSLIQQCALKASGAHWTSGTHGSAGTHWRWLSGILHSHLSEFSSQVNFSFYQQIKPWASVVLLLPWGIHYLICCSGTAPLGSPIHETTSTFNFRWEHPCIAQHGWIFCSPCSLLWEVPPDPALQLPPHGVWSCANTQLEVQGAHCANVQREMQERASSRQGYSVVPTVHQALLCPLSESRKRFHYAECGSALVPLISLLAAGKYRDFFFSLPFRDPSPASPGKPDSTNHGCYGGRFLWASLPWRNGRQSCRQSIASAMSGFCGFKSGVKRGFLWVGRQEISPDRDAGGMEVVWFEE